MELTIDQLKTEGLLLFECISGSRAYGLQHAQSDTDIRGVFVLPQDQFYGLNYVAQLQNETNDIVYYELGRFIELLARNNPNMLELLSMPKDCILYKHPLYSLIKDELFLSKLCKDTFAKYAFSQIKKARGLNKKILNPEDGKRKSVMDFCFVAQGQASVPLAEFLDDKDWKQQDTGLARIAHMPELYGLYHKPGAGFSGVIRKERANEVALSSIPKGLQPEALMSFNKQAYSAYCKRYKEYHQWVEKRNDARYQNTLQHGKNYDAKNMMHTFRLLDTAREIGQGKGVQVRRPNREELLRIKNGDFSYEELLQQAELQLAEIDQLYQQTPLPEKPDMQQVEALLVSIRKEFYQEK